MATSASTQIREGWQELPLIECTSDRQISYGVVQPGFPVTDGVPIVRVNNLVNGRIITNDAMRIAPEIDYSHRRTKLRGGEILISLVGTTGSVAIVPDELSGWNVARAIAVIRPDEKIGASWLKLCLESSHTREYLDARANTTVQKTLNLKDVKQLPIPLPPPHWRQEILSLVSPIENAITNLEDQNRSLEATAQAIFKSWFVDFDPVRAKAEGREPEGMDADTAALFPSEFRNSEIGPIPMGWGFKSLGEIATFQNGFAFKSSDWVESGFLVVKIGNVKPGIVDLSGCSFVREEAVGGLDRFRLSDGDLLVGMTGYVGETGLMPILDEPCYLNQRVGRLSTGSGLSDLGFVYCLVRRKEYKAFAEAQAHGSAQANVSGASLLSYPMVVPPSPLIEAFNGLVNPILRSILSKHRHGQLLGMIRDTLLPRLISGKLRVPEAEAMLMEVM